jgi:predicted DCC family thiol-disulfide oxidoreductase YuxK
MLPSRVQQPHAAEGAHLILYDGVCGLCSRLNQFVIARDDQRHFHFASLQSAAGRAALAPFGITSQDLTTFYVLAHYRGAAPVQLTKSRAALFVMTTLGWPWRAAGLLYLLPKRLADRVYDVIARHRYRICGREEECLLPDPAHRTRFIDQSGVTL